MSQSIVYAALLLALALAPTTVSGQPEPTPAPTSAPTVAPTPAPLPTVVVDCAKFNKKPTKCRKNAACDWARAPLKKYKSCVAVTAAAEPTPAPTPAPVLSLMDPDQGITWKKYDGCCRATGESVLPYDVETVTGVDRQSADNNCFTSCSTDANCTAYELLSKKGKPIEFRCELFDAKIDTASRASKSCKRAFCNVKGLPTLPANSNDNDLPFGGPVPVFICTDNSSYVYDGPIYDEDGFDLSTVETFKCNKAVPYFYYGIPGVPEDGHPGLFDLYEVGDPNRQQKTRGPISYNMRNPLEVQGPGCGGPGFKIHGASGLSANDACCLCGGGTTVEEGAGDIRSMIP